MDPGHSSIAFSESTSKFKRSIMISSFMKIRMERRAGDEFTVDVYLSFRYTKTGTPTILNFNTIYQGDETGNFTVMKLDKPINVTSSRITYTVPNVPPGNHILNTFVKYPFGGVVLIYTIETQIK
jgi:hypothetical protein